MTYTCSKCGTKGKWRNLFRRIKDGYICTACLAEQEGAS